MSLQDATLAVQEFKAGLYETMANSFHLETGDVTAPSIEATTQAPAVKFGLDL